MIVGKGEVFAGAQRIGTVREFVALRDPDWTPPGLAALLRVMRDEVPVIRQRRGRRYRRGFSQTFTVTGFEFSEETMLRLMLEAAWRKRALKGKPLARTRRKRLL